MIHDARNEPTAPILDDKVWKVPHVVDAGTVVWREPRTDAERALVAAHIEEQEAVQAVRARRQAAGSAAAPKRAAEAPSEPATPSSGEPDQF